MRGANSQKPAPALCIALLSTGLALISCSRASQAPLEHSCAKPEAQVPAPWQFRASGDEPSIPAGGPHYSALLTSLKAPVPSGSELKDWEGRILVYVWRCYPGALYPCREVEAVQGGRKAAGPGDLTEYHGLLELLDLKAFYGDGFVVRCRTGPHFAEPGRGWCETDLAAPDNKSGLHVITPEAALPHLNRLISEARFFLGPETNGCLEASSR